MNKLYTISSCATVPSYIETHLLNAEKLGAQARSDFVEERLKTGENVFATIMRMNLKTLASIKTKVNLTSSQSKVVVYKHQGNMVKSQHSRINMSELMKYCLTHVPYCIWKAD